MKFFIATLILFTLNSTFANDPSDTNTTQPSSDQTKKSKDWTHKRLEQVAAILPEKTQDKKTIQRPEQVQLKSPRFLSTINGTTAQLEWSKVNTAKFYHVQVSKDAGFNNRSMIIADEKWISSESFEVSNLESGHKYFWRVAALNNENESMFTKSLFTTSAFETK